MWENADMKTDILKPFCGTDRFVAPFRCKDGLRYATDTMVCVRASDGIPAPMYSQKEPKVGANAQRLFDLVDWSAADWKPLPTIRPCGRCKGTGKLHGSCSCCNHKCGGECPCKGETESKEHDILLGGVKISRFHARRIQSLCNVRWMVHPKQADTIAFTWNWMGMRGQGLLMGLADSNAESSA